ncbi:RNA chaperone Hfq [Laceyella putida]|jgi:host factor-I protein|uniref:RNA chaperone Hfq n=1 Tax=Laceyella putida TaxID=110101 RepID=A0ABW2RG51_9BACL
MNNVQDLFLQELLDNQMAVTLFLINGFQYQGQIRRFDKFTVSIEVEGSQFLIFKKMISTVQTAEPLRLEW